MTQPLNYPDTATFVSVSSGTYAGTKTIVEQADVPVVFLQSTGMTHGGFQDSVQADAVCYPDFTDKFVVDNVNRLEGMYILMSLFDSSASQSWYKVSKCSVNRDHLLGNTIDNIELLLKKASPVPGVS